MSSYEVAIVGGGIAGLTAAYEATKFSKSVVVLDPGDLGGMLLSKTIDGFQIETSAHILTAKSALRELCKELGLSLISPSEQVKKQAFFIKGKQISFKKNPFSLFSAGLLPPKEIVNALKNLLLPSKKFSGSSDMSVADFMTLFAGKSIATEVLGPMLRGIYGASIDELSSRWIFSSLWSRLNASHQHSRAQRGASCRIMGGNNALISALVKEIAGKVTVEATKVEDLQTQDSKLILKGGSTTLEAQTLIWTADMEPLGYTTQRYVPITVTHIACRRLPMNLQKHLGVLFGKGNKDPLLGIMCCSELFPDTSPQDRSLLALMFGGEAALRWSHDDVEKFIREDLAKEFPLTDPKVIHLQTWPRAIPLYEVGHGEKVAALHKLEQRFPGLFLASRITSKPGVSDRVEAAKIAASRARQNLLLHN